MSTVLLMTDTWHPTVLRIVPFSNNNAKHIHKRQTPRGPNNSRGFPVLAVTRSGKSKRSANSETRTTSGRSLTSARSEKSTAKDNASETSEQINRESVHTRLSYTSSDTVDGQVSKRGGHMKYAKKKVPDMHSEMKEAIKFSVQDLNDQVSSNSSISSSDPTTESKTSKDTHDRVDNTRTKLPKPSFLTSDSRYYARVNGVRRSVPLTPGELELDRIRNNYIVEQAQKRKKYKLNINQLPRSTTPVNDHDPDKLNMKQVIAFLQTKTSKHIQKKNVTLKPNEISGKVYKGLSTTPDMVLNSSSLRTPSSNTEQGMSSSNSDLKYMDKTDNTRLDNTGCVSVLSTKSTPNLPYGYQHVKSPRKTNNMSVKSFGDRSSNKRPTKQKPLTEFKLYRFLAIAPDGQTPGLATTLPEDVTMVDTSSFTNVNSQNNLSPRTFLRRKSRETTANILHRHAVNKNKPVSPTTEKRELDDSGRTVRLPSVAYTGRETPDDDAASCSTTSATCNSTKNSSKEERNKYPKKGKCITFSDEKHDQHLETTNFEEDDNNNIVPNINLGFPTRSYKAPEFPKVNINGPRHIHINMPHGNSKGYSQEIVRLTLRQDKNATRVTSYMSDIQSTNPSQWHEEERSDIDEGISSTSVMSMNQYENKELLETSRQLINNISNNNFIKVRQKLKSTNLLNVDK